ncbi:hypothetical protein ElyMa_002519900 [Elysia marginata]|uniref:Uncharacterized protein n=1 Tax=Elysia marginata TaxID=1093978 RepID=A0AAV4GRR2_9GAST|nr:hypothetical protein ElyMa_002519900 [Elysia marginata]
MNEALPGRAPRDAMSQFKALPTTEPQKYTRFYALRVSSRRTKPIIAEENPRWLVGWRGVISQSSARYSISLPTLGFSSRMETIDFMRYGPAQEDEARSGGNRSESKADKAIASDVTTSDVPPLPRAGVLKETLDFMRYEPAQEGEVHSGGIPRWLMGWRGPVSQSSAVKTTLPMGVITSYVIVVAA